MRKVGLIQASATIRRHRAASQIFALPSFHHNGTRPISKFVDLLAVKSCREPQGRPDRASRGRCPPGASTMARLPEPLDQHQAQLSSNQRCVVRGVLRMEAATTGAILVRPVGLKEFVPGR